MSAQNFLPCWHLSKFLRQAVNRPQVHTLILASIFIVLYFGNHINISSGSIFSCSSLWLLTLVFFISFLFPQLDYLSLSFGVINSHLVLEFCISVITSWAIWSWVSKARPYAKLHYLCSASKTCSKTFPLGWLVITALVEENKSSQHKIKSKSSS